MPPLILPRQTVLLIGDSITDAQRQRDLPDDLGRGYAWLTAARFQSTFPEHGVRFLNRGISGHRAVDLRARWQADCLDLQPDWVSILIGINDTWRRFDRNDPTSVDDFADHYHAILTATRASRPDARFILLEPFLLPCPPDRVAWRADLEPKITVVRRLAVEFGALLVPLDGLFAAAAARAPAPFWAPDGVHPTPAGHGLIADAWLRTVGAVF